MNFKYRPDIDGLRAIAVISVIIFHAEFTFLFNETNYILLRGGLLGVDIFFVISGFLIGNIILNEINNKKIKPPFNIMPSIPTSALNLKGLSPEANPMFFQQLL